MIIDVSNYNGKIEWEKIADKIKGAIIRVGYRGYISGKKVVDGMFSYNLKNVISNKIPFGIYFMSQAVSVEEAIEEADFCMSWVKPNELSFPVYIDSEWSNQKKNGRADKLTREARTNICKAFCNRLSLCGYEAGVYASKAWYETKLYVGALLPYHIWCAQYNNKLTAKHRVDLWQFSSHCRVYGIMGYVDGNETTSTFMSRKTAADNMVYWITVADMPTLESAKRSLENFKKAYPKIDVGLRSAKIEDVNVLN